MGDNAKHASSYQLDQEILDARGINMTVEEVAGLPTVKYAERVQSLRLSEDDHAFLKGLRRRIKNRLASQNSRRRSMEHLRRLTRELRAVRACRDDALAERRALVRQRDTVQTRCQRLRQHVIQILHSRGDHTQVPSIDIERITESPSKETPTKKNETNRDQCAKEKDTFECRLDKLVQQSVNHIFKENKDKKKVCAKTVFISNEMSCIVHTSDIKNMVIETDFRGVLEEEGVLNLSVKEGKRKSHGRKQLAPRRIAYYDNDDGVLDLKVKKETP